ncbi:NosD domain-containing protein [Patescibacteria group bacterium]
MEKQKKSPKNLLYFFITSFFLLFLVPYKQVSAAQTYYVSTSGKDSNPGTINSPWATLSKAATSVQPGDTVYTRGGIYHQSVTISKSGASSQPITFASYQDEKVVIDASGLSSYSVLRLSGDWLIVQGFEVQNTKVEGAAILIEGNHCIVRNNKVHDCWDAAIHINGNYGLAEGNTVWNNGLVNENGGAGGWPAVVSCVRNYSNPTPQHCTLRKNTVWNNWGEGISVFEQIYTTIEDNISYNNQQNIYLSDTKYSIVQRNIVYCTPGNAIGKRYSQNGILIGDEKGVLIDGVRRSSSNNKVINNMVVGCDRNIAAGAEASANNLIAYNTFINSSNDGGENANVLIYVAGSCSSCRFTNNLVYQGPGATNPITIGGNSDWIMSNNLWSKTPSPLFRGINDINNVDPLLANVITPSVGNISSDNFKILSSSPVINKALVLGEVTTDYFGNSRDSFPDIGAHEYGGSEPPPPSTNLVGDVNNDNKVNILDLAIVATCFRLPPTGDCQRANLNNDNLINVLDLLIVANHFGQER